MKPHLTEISLEFLGEILSELHRDSCTFFFLVSQYLGESGIHFAFLSDF